MRPLSAPSSRFALADQFRAIAEIGGDVAWIIDCASGQPRYISPAIVELLGYPIERFAVQLAAPDAASPLAALCGGLAERVRRYQAGDLSRLRLVRQFEVTHADGSMVPIEQVSTLLLDETGAADSVVGVLRSLVAQRAQEAAQRRFASMLNHEFRTPLSTIDGAIQRLEVTGVKADEATRKRYRNIAVAVDRLIAMLDDYLTPVQLAGTGQVRASNALDPRVLLREGCDLARASGRSASVELGELPALLRCDPQGLRLALKVLVSNAVLYTPESSPISLSGQRADGGVELLVRDGGAGVPQAELEKIFGKSYRGSNAGDRPGSGLGLYMARAVVEVHGGTLTASNVVGAALDRPADAQAAGASFRIWLPAQGGKGKEVASGEPSSDNPSRKTG